MEKKLWYSFLRTYPVKMYKQRLIRTFIVDFYCPLARLVIELDGSQHYTEQGMQYDMERSAVFEQYGVQVLRFTKSGCECSILKWCVSKFTKLL
ncbi:MAG: endonuclease domain-containing protein [Faecalibacterium sp.]